MYKKNYISREEHELWQYIREKDIIDAETVSFIFPEMPKSKRNKLMHSLYKKGYLKRAIRGLYYNPENLKDFYALALRIKEGYIGMASALRYYNLIEYEDFTIYVMTKNFRKSITLEGTEYEIRFTPLGRLFLGFEKKDSIYVSSLEKTLFDCLLKPGITGLSVLTKALYSSKPDWNKVLSFFKMTTNNALYQRTGYLFWLMKKETRMRMPEDVLRFLAKKVKNPVKLTSNKNKSTFIPEWKVQDNIGKENILSWWY